jgi:hypothetical protein
MVAAGGIAPIKFLRLRSNRVAMRRQSFEATEHALGDLAQFVDSLVVVILDFAVFARRDDGLCPARFEPFSQRFAFVALVGN